MFTLLCAHGADLSLCTDNGESVMHVAAMTGATGKDCDSKVQLLFVVHRHSSVAFGPLSRASACRSRKVRRHAIGVCALVQASRGR